MDFFAALICSPEIAKPSQYLPGFWGGEMAHDEAFADRKEARTLSRLSRLRTLPPEKVMTPVWICIDNSKEGRHPVAYPRLLDALPS